MLLSDVPERTAALSALAGSRAWRLYESEGFLALHDRFRFPGGPTEHAILVKRLQQAEAPDITARTPAVTGR